MPKPTSKPKEQHSMVHGLRQDSESAEDVNAPVSDGDAPVDEDTVQDDTQKRHRAHEVDADRPAGASPREGGDPERPRQPPRDA